MRIGKIGIFIATRLQYFVVGAFCLQLAAADAPSSPNTELKFDLLKIGTQTFTNVTVTSRNADYVFLMHKGGMITFQVADLPDSVRAELGYKVASNGKSGRVATWAKEKMTQMQSGEMEHLERQWQHRLRAAAANRAWLTPNLIALAVVFALLLHLFFSYCSLLICRKTGNEPGVLIWIPLLQLVPLFRAARMSPVWILAMLVPLVNFVVQVVWSVKIVQARAKSGWLALLLLLPLTSLFAFLYLAFSTAPAPKEEAAPPKLMTLEVA
jgi:hypothetical protein